MKKTILSALMLATTIFAHAQVVTENNFSRLSLSYTAPDEHIVTTGLGGQKYMQINAGDYVLTGRVGSPALPVFSKLIEIPFCADVKINISNMKYDTIGTSVSLTWLPMQRPPSKSDTGTVVVIDEKVYSTDDFVSMPLASVSDIAVARDRRIATLTISPFSLNPLTGQYVVCRSADITIEYIGADSVSTNEHYNRYNTPAFSVGETLNKLYGVSSSKSIRTSAPTRMIVVVPTTLECNAVGRFVEWKRRCGMLVDVVNYGTGSITSNTDLASHLLSYYENATTESPAPTYILLLGDNEQLPAFSSRMPNPSNPNYDPSNDHITDLYFVTWTSGDIVPDCYQGRLSAKDTNTLTSIINKTLLYESYSFPDPSYLANAVLISGVDGGYSGDNAYKYSDPTMDYIANLYVNSNNGYSNVKYYKNNTSFAPTGVSVTGSSQSTSTASTLRNLYNAGAGWVNYSAHGNWNEWSIPEFTVTNVNSMANNNRPMFMIGNCCLTNKFEKATCFGESLLRKGNNAGAVAYIGGTNSTYWPQDFYWSVGVRSNISNTMNTNYNSSNLGMYDRLFHTHNESRINQAITAGAMLFFGNNAVQGSSSSASFKKYYWEIYELMGDPSLMPWLGLAETLPLFSASASENTIYITTVPYAYVALIDTTTHNLVKAVYTTSSGNATIQLPGGVDLSRCSYAVTAQGYKPYFSVPVNVHVDLGPVATEVKLYPNPATTSCTIVCDSMRSVSLMDSRGTLLNTFTPSDSICHINLQGLGLPSGIYFVQVQTADSLCTQKLIVK